MVKVVTFSLDTVAKEQKTTQVAKVRVLQCAGPWSDTNGRKLLIVLPFVGQTLAVLVLIIALLLQDLPAEFLLLW